MEDVTLIEVTKKQRRPFFEKDKGRPDRYAYVVFIRMVPSPELLQELKGIVTYAGSSYQNIAVFVPN